MGRGANVACPTPSGAAPTSRATMDRRRCPANQEAERVVAGAFFLALAQIARADDPEDGSTSSIDDGDDHLRVTRYVEDDPVNRRAVCRDSYELARVRLLHLFSVLAHRSAAAVPWSAPSGQRGPSTAEWSATEVPSSARATGRCGRAPSRSAPGR